MSAADESMKKTMTYLTVGLFVTFLSIIMLANIVS